MKESLQGRASKRVRDFALYGETTGEVDEFGLPVRFPWASEYRGEATVVYGHTPVVEAQWLNRTMCIDTGCVFGGALTALRYPEKELVSVDAAEMYAEPGRPLQGAEEGRTIQHIDDDVLDIADVLGKRIIDTDLMRRITATVGRLILSMTCVWPHFISSPRKAKSTPIAIIYGIWRSCPSSMP